MPGASAAAVDGACRRIFGDAAGMQILHVDKAGPFREIMMDCMVDGRLMTQFRTTCCYPFFTWGEAVAVHGTTHNG